MLRREAWGGVAAPPPPPPLFQRTACERHWRTVYLQHGKRVSSTLLVSTLSRSADSRPVTGRAHLLAPESASRPLPQAKVQDFWSKIVFK